MAKSVMPLMVYVFPLLVCPYAKMLADQICPTEVVNVEIPWTFILMKEEKQIKGTKKNSQLMPLRTERATSLAASSYTCFVGLSFLNTRSTEKKKKTQGGSTEGRNFSF